MAIDSSIPLQVQQFKPPDQLNMLAQVMQVQGAQNQNALAQYSLAKAQRQDEETNRMAQLLSGGGIDLSTPEGQSKLYQVAPITAPTVIKGFLDAQKTKSGIALDTAHAGSFDAEAAAKRTAQYRDQLANVTNPDQAAAWLKAQYADPVVGKIVGAVPFEQAASQIPTDPAQLAQWVQRNALGMTKYIELNAPKTNVINTGGVTNVVQTPGLGGAPTVAGTFTNTQSPDNIATNATHVQTTGMTNATSRANNADTINSENLRAGVVPGGGLDDNSERTAQAIASGQLPAPTGMALLNPKNQRILGRVMEINPQYDSTTVTAKKAAAVAFTSGNLGNALRSVSTANAHLDQLNELVDGMQNGNTQVVNKVANYFATQTGNPAVTNFQAIKNIVGQEVVKAIVAGGGGVGEREEAAKIFSDASSPAQLKGAISHYRMVMGAQASNLLAQRRAAGLPDSTIPDYSGNAAGTGGGAAAPAGWQYLGVQK